MTKPEPFVEEVEGLSAWRLKKLKKRRVKAWRSCQVGREVELRITGQRASQGEVVMPGVVVDSRILWRRLEWKVAPAHQLRELGMGGALWAQAGRVTFADGLGPLGRIKNVVREQRAWAKSEEERIARARAHELGEEPE